MSKNAAPDYVTPAQAAELLGVSSSTVRRAILKHTGLAVRVGKPLRIPASHVERLLRGDSPANIARDARAGSPQQAAE